MTLAGIYEGSTTGANTSRSRPSLAHDQASRAAEGLPVIPRRILQVIPPILAWGALTSPGWAAVVAPAFLGYFLVAFSAYWLWRSCEFAAGLLIGLGRLHEAQSRDWAADGNALPGYNRMHHLVFVPTYKESDEILSATLDCIAAQTVPLES